MGGGGGEDSDRTQGKWSKEKGLKYKDAVTEQKCFKKCFQGKQKKLQTH